MKFKTIYENNEVSTKEDFIDFLEFMSKDFTENKHEWENHTLCHYLESIAAWVRDMDGDYSSLGEDASNNKDINWGLIAGLFSVGKIYE
tara:strand:- start:802 stop:1068 length:267 start_codon:yes stop_codon:yes gene_type:complete